MSGAILVFLTFGLPGGGEATPTAPPNPKITAPATTSGEVSRGETLFRAGVSAFDRRDYAAAVKLFEDAHQVSRAPEILFDIGQAYRSLGDCQHALDAYEAFTKAADANDPLIPRARARQAELQSCIRTSPAPAIERSPTPPEPAPAKSVLVAPLTEASSRSLILGGAPAAGGSGTVKLRTTCVAAAAASAAIGGVGMALGLQAWSLARSVEGTQVWDPRAQRDDERGRAFADVSTSLLIVAGATAAITTAGCWWGWRTTQGGGGGRTIPLR